LRMRLLILSDSHGRGMCHAMESLDIGIQVMTVRKGRKIPSIRGLYRDKLRSIRRFRPDVVFIHVGHNDLVPHLQFNPRPLFITSIMHQVRELVQEVSVTLPGVYIVVSSILPRVIGDGLTASAVGRYNRLAKRFGEMVRSASRGPGAFFLCTVNRSMWGRIARYEPLTGYHKDDGLHLNAPGLRRLALGWLSLVNAIRDME
jgi:lysophospholipase L1-like esterase